MRERGEGVEVWKRREKRRRRMDDCSNMVAAEWLLYDCSSFIDERALVWIGRRPGSFRRGSVLRCAMKEHITPNHALGIS